MFCFFLGVDDFSSKIQGYENMILYCPICHNISAIPLHEKKFFTICFIPLIPYSLGKVIRCTICSWFQDTNDAELYRISQLPNLRPA
ncbi:hypothetical protein T552_00649 [Pneumocystis carinii B80]|uniref:Zinc-ribbon 15 domain-containing protein n=1 Tax=Pneumocystis carinii (strain B80) TaxID=1408658 RepID=A0A0W4ZP60_PNEC8|nr:hypothetical protein T552_00649 [Pneumocystis carinii B80]KTW30172.1 hypothetical protein T552_00649 [Pneumocystis carinii B80]